MLANRRKRNSNTLLRAIDASEDESLCSVFVETFDLKDSFFVINENIFNLNHTYKVAQKPRKVKKNFRLFYCTIPARGAPPRAKPLTTRRLPSEPSYSTRPANGKRVKLQVGDWHRPNPRGEASSTDDCGVVS